MPKNQPERIIDSPFQVPARGGATSISPGSSVVAHALNDTAIHTGTLDWSQLNKTGSSLADLATRAHSALTGVTANQHHNQSHVLATTTALGPDHTISGAAAGQVLRALSATTAAFDVLQHDDLGGVTANQHHNQSHVLATTTALGPDHTVSGLTSGQVLQAISATTAKFGALDHDALSNVTANQHHNRQHGITSASDHTATGTALDVVGLSVANTLGILTPTSNPSAAETLLKSSASGGLQLRNFYVTGNVTFMDNSDVDLIMKVDATQQNVGFGRIPDPQFTVDVSGPLRADYLIGKHAIQLDDVKFLNHYDAKGPYNTNKAGRLDGHRGQVATYTGDTQLNWGKFGGAVEVSAGYTNVIANPQFDGGSVTGYSNHGTGTGTRAASQSFAYAGAYSYRLEKTGGANTAAFGTITQFSATSGVTYYASYWVFVEAISGGLKQLQIALTGTAFTATTTEYVFSATPGAGEYPLNTWVRLTVSAAASSTATGDLRFRIHDATTATVYADAFQVTTGSHKLYYSGTRTAGSLSYGGVDVNWRTMTWMAWIKPPATGSQLGVEAHIGDLYVDGSNRYELYLRNIGNTLRFAVNGTVVVTTASGVTVEGWNHIAVTVDDTAVTVYINGVSVGTGTISGALPVGTPTLYVGVDQGGTKRLDAAIDDFVITGRVESADSIRSIYESDAPVFAESSVFSFRATPDAGIWANDDGLWVMGGSGEVFGVYRGVTLGYSWAGLSLDPNDVVIGDKSRGAAFLWDDSAGEISIGNTAANNSYVKITGSQIVLRRNSIDHLTFDSSGNVVFRDVNNVQRIIMDSTGVFAIQDGSTVNRIHLSSAGILSILDSGGSTVFKFDASAGAEFTKSLTLGTSGGIYQGSGTFASPTTGLKLFNSGGIGKLSGYNGGTEQVTFDTDGKLKAGFFSSAWRVTLDRGGLLLDNNSDNAAHVKWGTSSDPVALIGAYSSLFHFQSGSSSANGDLVLSARFNTGANDFSDILLPGATIGSVGEIILRPDRGTGTKLLTITETEIGNTIGPMGIGVDVGSIRGNLHVYLNSGGFMHYSVSGMSSANASPTTIVPNGTGDVTARLYFLWTIKWSGGGSNSGAAGLTLGGADVTQVLETDGGSNICYIRLTTTGAVNIYRDGTGSYTISMILFWI